jgi:hypothetical protein
MANPEAPAIQTMRFWTETACSILRLTRMSSFRRVPRHTTNFPFWPRGVSYLFLVRSRD